MSCVSHGGFLSGLSWRWSLANPSGAQASMRGLVLGPSLTLWLTNWSARSYGDTHDMHASGVVRNRRSFRAEDLLQCLGAARATLRGEIYSLGWSDGQANTLASNIVQLLHTTAAPRRRSKQFFSLRFGRGLCPDSQLPKPRLAAGIRSCMLLRRHTSADQPGNNRSSEAFSCPSDQLVILLSAGRGKR